MMNENILVLYSLAVFILTLSPGPDILFLISTTLNRNLNNAIITAFGLCSGILIHTAGTAFGLGYFVSKFPELLSLIKLIGCMYLIYLSYLYFPNKKHKTIINKKKLKIIKIPMPSPKIIEGTRVPATYLNFYIANKIVLVPVFNDAKDKIVINIFKKNFKSRKIIPINCSELIWGFGAIHCMTQQEPI